MFDVYLTDKINICRRVIDQWGAETETSQTNISAYVEPGEIVIHSIEGKEIKGSALVMVDYDVDIEYNDRIQIVTLNGVTYDLSQKKFEVLDIKQGKGFSNNHLEIVI